MGFFKKFGKVVKKAAPYALGAAGAHFLSPFVSTALQSARDYFDPPDPVELGRGDGGVNRIEVTGSDFDYNPLIAGASRLIGGQQANYSNAQQASRQMEFQASQSGSAHQREVADLKAAGLNPILSAGGSGAMSGSGASANIQDVVGPSVSSALEVRRAQDDHDNARSTNKLIKAQTAKTLTDQSSSAASIPFQIQSARKAMADAGLSEAELAGAQNKSSIESGTFGKFLAYIRSITSALGLNTSVNTGFSASRSASSVIHK